MYMHISSDPIAIPEEFPAMAVKRIGACGCGVIEALRSLEREKRFSSLATHMVWFAKGWRLSLT